jgi:hypothetical protein
MRLHGGCQKVRGRRVSASGEVPVIEDERGIAVDVGHQSGGLGLFALVGGAVGAQAAQGDGVGAALGAEVAAKAEHVRPCGKPQVVEPGQLAAAEAFGDMAAAWSRMGSRSIRSAGVMRQSRVPVHSAALVAYLAT